MKKAVKLFISGNVQGVFFRAFIKEEAEKNNVKGFVRNLEDGRIEIFLENLTHLNYLPRGEKSKRLSALKISGFAWRSSLQAINANPIMRSDYHVPSSHIYAKKVVLEY